MDFAWNDEQAAFRKEVLRFAREELKDDVITRDRNEEFSRPLWEKCAKFGIQGLPIPTEYGGGGADTLTTVCALEALGYGCQDNGLLFSINAHMWSSEIPIWTFGTEAQRRKYLPGPGRVALDEGQAGDGRGGRERQYCKHCADQDVQSPATRPGERRGGY